MGDYSTFQCIMFFILEQTFTPWVVIALYHDVMYHVLCVTVNLVYQLRDKLHVGEFALVKAIQHKYEE